jgi:hypothetical protein
MLRLQPERMAAQVHRRFAGPRPRQMKVRPKLGQFILSIEFASKFFGMQMAVGHVSVGWVEALRNPPFG